MSCTRWPQSLITSSLRPPRHFGCYNANLKNVFQGLHCIHETLNSLERSKRERHISTSEAAFDADEMINAIEAEDRNHLVIDFHPPPSSPLNMKKWPSRWSSYASKELCVDGTPANSNESPPINKNHVKTKMTQFIEAGELHKKVNSILHN